MSKKHRSLTPADLNSLCTGYGDSFNDLLRNIIAGYADNPEKLGRTFAQLLIHSDLECIIERKEYREHIPFETDMLIAALMRQIVCFRFLQDWTLGETKTQEQTEELTKKFNSLADVDSIHEWATKLADGFWEYVKNFYESHKTIQSKYFDLLKERERRAKQLGERIILA